MLEYRYLGGLEVGKKGDLVDLTLVGGTLRLACPGLLGVGRWIYELPLQSIEDVRVSSRKWLVIQLADMNSDSLLRITGAWIDLEVAYSTIRRACPWLGSLEEVAVSRSPGRSRLVQALDMLQLLLAAVLVLFVSVFITIKWPL
jgi:hypothetical protein